MKIVGEFLFWIVIFAIVIILATVAEILLKTVGWLILPIYVFYLYLKQNKHG